MAPITVTVAARSGKPITDISIDSEATLLQLKKKFHAAKRKFYPSRQRLSLPAKEGQARGEALTKDGARLSDMGVANGTVLQFKDLGPQIGYATVFFWEYFGPMAIYPLFFLFPAIFYHGLPIPKEHALVQKLACAYWVGHYAKRILETFFVHEFSHDTMPVFPNFFRNCGYYWGFAAFVSYFVNHPLYTAPDQRLSVACFALAVLFQLSNLRCHIILANLRKPGEKGYKIPRGFLFNYITCANYFTEIMGWVLFTVGTSTLAAAMFTLAGAGQMAPWALKKHQRLKKIFNGKDGMEKYPRRWIMLPPFF